ncbi:hypothetical protein CGH25_15785 [Vibrio parahaemolyticus]|nr:hypothetical protein CGH25_15785 [Vibrio parahaemolyticus]TOO98404.1 hypothetical protein CGH24_20085 [Vibrio parahaemolyticus]TOQ68392.1 hypothetical protein CGG89_20530 [Vibrio parahaemolyticus]
MQKYSIEEVQQAINVIKESGSAFAPSLPEFNQYLKYGGINFDESYQRFLDGKPTTQEEKHIARKHGYDVRRMPLDKARQEHSRLMKLTIDAVREGRLKFNNTVKKLPVHSIRNINDAAREDAEVRGLANPERFPEGSVLRRIANMVQGKKRKV